MKATRGRRVAPEDGDGEDGEEVEVKARQQHSWVCCLCVSFATFFSDTSLGRTIASATSRLLLAADMASDVVVTASLYGGEGFKIGLALNLLPFAVLTAVLLQPCWKFLTSQKSRMPFALFVCTWLLLGPVAVFIFDLFLLTRFLFLDPEKTTNIIYYDRLRFMVECLFESVPQSIFQLVLFARVPASAKRAPERVMLFGSVAISVVVLVNHTFALRQEASDRKVPVTTHVRDVLMAGMGVLPFIGGIRSGRLTEVSYSHRPLPLLDTEVSTILEAAVYGQSLLSLGLSGVGFSPASFSELCRTLPELTTLRHLDVSKNDLRIHQAGEVAFAVLQLIPRTRGPPDLAVDGDAQAMSTLAEARVLDRSQGAEGELEALEEGRPDEDEAGIVSLIVDQRCFPLQFMVQARTLDFGHTAHMHRPDLLSDRVQGQERDHHPHPQGPPSQEVEKANAAAQRNGQEEVKVNDGHGGSDVEAPVAPETCEGKGGEGPEGGEGGIMSWSALDARFALLIALDNQHLEKMHLRGLDLGLGAADHCQGGVFAQALQRESCLPHLHLLDFRGAHLDAESKRTIALALDRSSGRSVAKSAVHALPLRDTSPQSPHSTSVGTRRLSYLRTDQWELLPGQEDCDLSSLDCVDSDALLVAIALQHNPTLTSLNLTSNHITDEGEHYLSNALRIPPPALRRLDLRSNLQRTLPGDTIAAAVLGSGSSGDNPLYSLDWLSGVALQEWRGKETIDLSGLELGRDGWAVVLQALDLTPEEGGWSGTVKDLDLAFTGGDDDPGAALSMQALLPFLSGPLCSLRRLRLDGCSLSPPKSSHRHFTDAEGGVVGGPGGMGDGADGAGQLAKALRRNRTLTCLEVRGTGLSPSGKGAIASALRSKLQGVQTQDTLLQFFACDEFDLLPGVTALDLAAVSCAPLPVDPAPAIAPGPHDTGATSPPGTSGAAEVSGADVDLLAMLLVANVDLRALNLPHRGFLDATPSYLEAICSANRHLETLTVGPGDLLHIQAEVAVAVEVACEAQKLAVQQSDEQGDEGKQGEQDHASLSDPGCEQVSGESNSTKTDPTPHTPAPKFICPAHNAAPTPPSSRPFQSGYGARTVRGPVALAMSRYTTAMSSLCAGLEFNRSLRSISIHFPSLSELQADVAAAHPGPHDAAGEAGETETGSWGGDQEGWRQGGEQEGEDLESGRPEGGDLEEGDEEVGLDTAGGVAPTLARALASHPTLAYLRIISAEVLGPAALFLETLGPGLAASKSLSVLDLRWTSRLPVPGEDVALLCASAGALEGSQSLKALTLTFERPAIPSKIVDPKQLALFDLDFAQAQRSLACAARPFASRGPIALNVNGCDIPWITVEEAEKGAEEDNLSRRELIGEPQGSSKGSLLSSGIRQIRKMGAGITGLHGFFSRK